MIYSDRAIEDVVAQYIVTRGKNGGVITISVAVKALRSALPDCPHSDRELADMIATAAVDAGCNIHFDSDRIAEVRP